jgi:hypothetical protein
MNGKGKATTAVAATALNQNQLGSNAKVNNLNEKTKDLERVLQFFHYKVGTSLDCSLQTGILRNSITWYIKELEELNIIQAIKKAKDSTTGFLAKHYSADHKLWQEKKNRQLELQFD